VDTGLTVKVSGPELSRLSWCQSVCESVLGLNCLGSEISVNLNQPSLLELLQVGLGLRRTLGNYQSRLFTS